MSDIEKVIKGLESHVNPKLCKTCAGDECPYYNEGGDFPNVTCVSILARDALEIILTQEANIKSYQRTIDRMNKVLMIWKEDS